jgi:SAM-dependent methyltransferase
VVSAGLPTQSALARQDFDRLTKILEARGWKLTKGAVLLDFGCGAGQLVKTAIDHGLDAYGCDVDFEAAVRHLTADETVVFDDLRSQGRLVDVETDRVGTRGTEWLPIGSVPQPFQKYRLPFDDEVFDDVVSSEVLEHVFNYSDVVSELHRVMKPGAVFLQMFPPKFALIEGHTNIPIGGGFKPDWWLKLWSKSGVRVWHHRGASAEEYHAWTRHYLDNCVNYLTKREITEAFSGPFDIEFVEREMFAISPKTRAFLLPGVYSHFRNRVMYGVRR